jgi:hypothetical protein
VRADAGVEAPAWLGEYWPLEVKLPDQAKASSRAPLIRIVAWLGVVSA